MEDSVIFTLRYALRHLASAGSSLCAAQFDRCDLSRLWFEPRMVRFLSAGFSCRFFLPPHVLVYSDFGTVCFIRRTIIVKQTHQHAFIGYPLRWVYPMLHHSSYYIYRWQSCHLINIYIPAKEKGGHKHVL